MAKVIVFETNGSVKLATLANEDTEICKENLQDFEPCPAELLRLVPTQIAKFCKETAPQYLYINEKDEWESVKDPIPV